MPWASSIPSTPSHHISFRSTHRSSECLDPFLNPCACCMSRPSHRPQFDNNSTGSFEKGTYFHFSQWTQSLFPTCWFNYNFEKEKISPSYDFASPNALDLNSGGVRFASRPGTAIPSDDFRGFPQCLIANPRVVSWCGHGRSFHVFCNSSFNYSDTIQWTDVVKQPTKRDPTARLERDLHHLGPKSWGLFAN